MLDWFSTIVAWGYLAGALTGGLALIGAGAWARLQLHGVGRILGPAMIGLGLALLAFAAGFQTAKGLSEDSVTRARLAASERREAELVRQIDARDAIAAEAARREAQAQASADSLQKRIDDYERAHMDANAAGRCSIDDDLLGVLRGR